MPWRGSCRTRRRVEARCPWLLPSGAFGRGGPHGGCSRSVVSSRKGARPSVSPAEGKKSADGKHRLGRAAPLPACHYFVPMSLPEIDMVVYPDECDAFGHLNQASFLSLFERARWEMLLKGPGMDVFTRAGAWPALRKTVIDYRAAAFPGDVLRFTQALTHHGRTSFTFRQRARRVRDDTLIASAEFVFVCIDREGHPVPIPGEFTEYVYARRDSTGNVQRLMGHGVNLAVEVRGEGPAVLFVHGYPLDRTVWSHQMDSIEGWRRIAPDLRCMGQSDAPDLG